MSSTSTQPDGASGSADGGCNPDKFELIPEYGRNHNFALTAIEGVAERFQIRGVVNAVLEEMLEDIEWTHSLNHGLNEKWSVENLQHKLQLASNELEERRAYDAHLKQEFREYGDKFVGELWALSFKITDLERDRSDSKTMIEQVDILTQKLARSEEMVRTLQRTMSLNRESYDEGINIKSAAVGTRGKNQDLLRAEPPVDLSLQNVSSSSQKKGSSDISSSATPDVASSAAAAPQEESNPARENATKLDIVEGKDPNQTVNKPEAESPNLFLLELDESTLLRVFSFLDALDVVNAALVNVAFYSKVDALFGLGNPVIQQDSKVESEVAGKEMSADKESEGAQLKEEREGSNMAAKIPPGVEVSDASASTATAEIKKTQQPKPAAVQGSVVLQGVATLPRKEESNKATSIVSQQQQPRNMLSNMLSKIGQQGNVGTTRASAGKTSGVVVSGAKGSGGVSADDSSVTTTTTTTTTTTETAKNFASMASSMAEKLSPAELSVILKMTEDLRAKDKMIVKIKAEREDLAARLEGTEAVKEFLISKVRDTERSLKKCQEDSVKVMQQISSDQEVISFLDTRVKDLELDLQRTISDWNASKEELKAYQSKAENRLSVLEDMLQFERQQTVDSEREWKSQKKVLVKEVKHCRAQVLALQAERDSFRQKNMQLKHALLSMNGGAGG